MVAMNQLLREKTFLGWVILQNERLEKRRSKRMTFQRAENPVTDKPFEWIRS